MPQVLIKESANPPVEFWLDVDGDSLFLRAKQIGGRESLIVATIDQKGIYVWTKDWLKLGFTATELR